MDVCGLSSLDLLLLRQIAQTPTSYGCCYRKLFEQLQNSTFSSLGNLTGTVTGPYMKVFLNRLQKSRTFV